LNDYSLVFGTNINELILFYGKSWTKALLTQILKMGEYKIKDIEVLTGIKAHTLRIWEKRYGIPSPSRTETKIRKYSDKDLKEILNVAILNKNGWKISRIAELNSEDKVKKVNDLQATKNDDIYYENLILALIELDEHLFIQTINNLISTFGVIETFSVHLTNFLERIGVMWITGTIQPGQEHFISHLIRQKMISITDNLDLPDKSSPKIFLFLPENEWHDLSLLFYHYILRSKGIFSIYMGQSLPYAAVIDSIKTLSPVAILTSCVASVEGDFYSDYFEKLKDDSNQLPIFAGGFQIINDKEKLKKWVNPVSNLKDLEPLFRLIE
jgi:DNA-binding transcriptional MerR regulator